MIVGLIPARGGSKGIPGKNLKLLGGKPLLQWTVETCAPLRKWYDLQVVVSTDSDAIAAFADSLGVRVLRRPAELAEDVTPMRAVVEHAVDDLRLERDDIVVLLQPTSPFRTEQQIRNAWFAIRDDVCDSVISVREIPYQHSPEWALERTPKGLGRWSVPSDFRPTRRQDLAPAYYRDGEIYAFRAGLADRFPMCGRVLLQDGADHEPCNLDTPADWQRAERIFEDRASLRRFAEETCAPAGAL